MHRNLRRSAAAVALAVVAFAAYACKEGGSSGPTDPKETAGGIANSARSDADILGLMQEANRAEVQAGQLALQISSNADVKSFATIMLSEHNAIETELASLATQLNITPTIPSDASTSSPITDRLVVAIAPRQATPETAAMLYRLTSGAPEIRESRYETHGIARNASAAATSCGRRLRESRRAARAVSLRG